MSNEINTDTIPTPAQADGYGSYWDEVVAKLTDAIVHRSTEVVMAYYNDKPIDYNMTDPNFRKDNVRIRAMASAQEKLAEAGWMMLEIMGYQPLYEGYQPRNDGSTVFMRIESLESYHRKEEAAWAKVRRHTKMVRYLKYGLLIAAAGLIAITASYIL